MSTLSQLKRKERASLACVGLDRDRMARTCPKGFRRLPWLPVLPPPVLSSVLRMLHVQRV